MEKRCLDRIKEKDKLQKNILELLLERGNLGYEMCIIGRLYRATYGVRVFPDNLGVGTWSEVLGQDKLSEHVEIRGIFARMREDKSPLPSRSSSSGARAQSSEEEGAYRKEGVKQPDIEKIKSAKPQNFDAARNGLRVQDGYRMCSLGCGEQIVVGNKKRSSAKWAQNQNNIEHQKICPKKIYFEEWKAAFEKIKTLPRDTPTPATYDKACRMKKSDVGFQYGTGAFLLGESQAKKERRKKEKLKEKAKENK